MPRRATATAKSSRISLSSAAAGTFKAPPPTHTPRPGPIPRALGTGTATARADPDEVAAFKPLPYRDLPTSHGRRTSTTAVEQAKLRMLARAPGQPRIAEAEAEAVPTSIPDDDDRVVDEEDEENEPPLDVPVSPSVPVPPSVPPPQPDPAALLTAHLPTVADIDRLWDWIRADGDAGAAFFSRPITSSVELHLLIAAIIAAEPYAVLRALAYRDQHLGFAMLAPVLHEERTALMHVYLRADVRGHLAALLPTLIDLAAQAAPGMHLAVSSPDPVLARFHRSTLVPLGFREHVMFIR